MFDLRVQLFRHVQRQSLGYFASAKSGEVVSRVLNDVQGVGHMMQENLIKLLQNAVVFAVSSAVIFSLDWRLALVAFGLLPAFIYPARRVGRTRKTLKRRAQARMAEVTGILMETLSVSGALLLKVFGTEKKETKRLEAKARELMDISLRHNLVGRWFQMLMKLFEELGPVMVWAGGRLAGRARKPEARDHRRLRRAAAKALRARVGPGRRARRRRHVVRVLRSHLRRAGPRAGDPQRARRHRASRGQGRDHLPGPVVLVRARRAAAPRHRSRHPAGRMRRDRRAVGRGQEHAGGAGAAASTTRPRARSWSTATTSARCASSRCARTSASSRRRRTCSTPRSWTTCATRVPTRRRRGGAGGARGADPRLHRRPAGRIRDDRRRARLPPLGRRAAAPCDRAGAAQGSEDPDPGRGDELARLDERGADPGGAGSPAASGGRA